MDDVSATETTRRHSDTWKDTESLGDARQGGKKSLLGPAWSAFCDPSSREDFEVYERVSCHVAIEEHLRRAVDTESPATVQQDSVVALFANLAGGYERLRMARRILLARYADWDVSVVGRRTR